VGGVASFVASKEEDYKHNSAVTADQLNTLKTNIMIVLNRDDQYRALADRIGAMVIPGGEAAARTEIFRQWYQLSQCYNNDQVDVDALKALFPDVKPDTAPTPRVSDR